MDSSLVCMYKFALSTAEWSWSINWFKCDNRKCTLKLCLITLSLSSPLCIHLNHTFTLHNSGVLQTNFFNSNFSTNFISEVLFQILSPYPICVDFVTSENGYSEVLNCIGEGGTHSVSNLKYQQTYQKLKVIHLPMQHVFWPLVSFSLLSSRNVFRERY
jgi:hypothetical protein